jgi:hypothetical protein
MGAPYFALSGPEKVTLGGAAGYHIHIEGRLSFAVIQQHVYVLENSRYFVILTGSFISEGDGAEVSESASTLRLIEDLGISHSHGVPLQ